MRKPSRRSLRATISRATLGAALAGTLTLATFAHANHDPYGSYYAWVDVVSVQPRYAEHYVNESVERCYQVGQPLHARGHSAGPPRHAPAHGYRAAHGQTQQISYRQNDYPSTGDTVAATVLGGVIGGVIGNKVGSGKSKRPLTVAGAVIGASVANSAVHRSHQRSTSQRHIAQTQQVSRRCEVVTEPRLVSYIDGYDVTYRFHGKRFTRVMDEHPGDRMRVRIDVEPII